MAKKKSVRAPMAVDKSNTPAWMRAVIIVMIVSFLGMGVAIGAVATLGGKNSGGTASTGDTIEAQYKPQVESAIAAAELDPNNPEVVIQVGHAYFEWAVALFESGQVPASTPIWKSAVSYYDKVLAVDPSHDIALGNKAFALYYAQDPGAPEALRAFIEGAAGNANLVAQLQNAEGMLAELESAATTTTP